MTGREKPIRLSADEDGLLRNLYVQFGIPRDQYKKRPAELSLLERSWKNLSGRSDSGPELVRYIQNQQKAKQRLAVPWPTFNGAHKRAPSFSDSMDKDRMEALKTAYENAVLPHGLGDDAVFWNSEIVEALAKEFSRLTGTIVPGYALLVIAEEKRKRGDWFKVGKRGHGRKGFKDLDQAGNM